MPLQKLFETICSLELTSVLNSDCLVRHILINDTLICLSQSLVEIGNIHVFIQYSGPSEPVIQILAGIEAKAFSKKYIGLLLNTRPLMSFQTFRRPCYINSLISDDIKHQFIENIELSSRFLKKQAFYSEDRFQKPF